MFEKTFSKGNTYVCTVDVARGTTKDYSAFIMLMLQNIQSCYL